MIGVYSVLHCAYFLLHVKILMYGSRGKPSAVVEPHHPDAPIDSHRTSFGLVSCIRIPRAELLSPLYPL